MSERKPIDAYELHPCIGFDKDFKPCNEYSKVKYFEQCDEGHSDEHEIVCYSLYAHREGQGLECFADFINKNEGEKICELLNGFSDFAKISMDMSLKLMDLNIKTNRNGN